MRTLLVLACLGAVFSGAEAQAWTLLSTDGPGKVEAVRQTFVVMHDGARQTMLWTPTLNVEGAGRVTLVFALPAPPENVQRLTPEVVAEFTKIAQLSWLDSAKKRGQGDTGPQTGPVVPSDGLSVHTLTTQGVAAQESLGTLLGELSLPEIPEKELKTYVGDNWTFAAISWDAKPGLQTLAPLRIDFASPAPLLPLRAMADLGGQVEAFFVSGEALSPEAEANLVKAGFSVAMDRRKLGPNPKKSMWIAGQTSFQMRNLGVGPKTMFLERFEVQRGFVAVFILDDLNKAARKWKTEPFAGVPQTSMKMETVEAVQPKAEAGGEGADAGAGELSGVGEPDGGASAVEGSLAGLGDVLEDSGDLDWTLILGGTGLLFFLGVVMAVQIRRRL